MRWDGPIRRHSNSRGDMDDDPDVHTYVFRTSQSPPVTTPELLQHLLWVDVLWLDWHTA